MVIVTHEWYDSVLVGTGKQKGIESLSENGEWRRRCDVERQVVPDGGTRNRKRPLADITIIIIIQFSNVTKKIDEYERCVKSTINEEKTLVLMFCLHVTGCRWYSRRSRCLSRDRATSGSWTRDPAQLELTHQRNGPFLLCWSALHVDWVYFFSAKKFYFI